MKNRDKQRKNKRKYNKRSSMDKSLNKTLPGFFMRWSIENPLEDHDKPLKVRIGHQNPIMALRLAKDDILWNKLRPVLDVRSLKWRMEIKIEFKFGEMIEPRIISGVGPLKRLDDVYQDTVEEMLNEANDRGLMDAYVTTHVLQEILPGQIIRDEDFLTEAS